MTLRAPQVGAARYAVYAVPGAIAADGPIGAELRGLAASWYAARPEITADARRYGFHATLKAPIRLAPGRTPEEFDAAVAAFAAKRGPVEVPALRLATMGAFRALAPTAASQELGRLADAAVRALDSFRAPLTSTELARRDPGRLTRRQHDHLLRWGYPYVFEEFRFHMTLTDPIPDADGHEVDAALRAHFAPVLGHAVPLHSIAVFEEAEPGAAFAMRSVHALTAAPTEVGR